MKARILQYILGLVILFSQQIVIAMLSTKRLINFNHRVGGVLSMSRKITSVAAENPNMLFANCASFDNLVESPALKAALKSQNIALATPIQKLSYTKILTGDDVVIGSETGSGKTFSYMLPLIDKFIADKLPPLQYFPTAVVMAPNKELCRQIVRMTQGIADSLKAQGLHIRIGAVPATA